MQEGHEEYLPTFLLSARKNTFYNAAETSPPTNSSPVPFPTMDIGKDGSLSRLQSSPSLPSISPQRNKSPSPFSSSDQKPFEIPGTSLFSHEPSERKESISSMRKESFSPPKSSAMELDSPFASPLKKPVMPFFPTLKENEEFSAPLSGFFIVKPDETVWVRIFGFSENNISNIKRLIDINGEVKYGSNWIDIAFESPQSEDIARILQLDGQVVENEMIGVRLLGDPKYNRESFVMNSRKKNLLSEDDIFVKKEKGNSSFLSWLFDALFGW